MKKKAYMYLVSYQFKSPQVTGFGDSEVVALELTSEVVQEMKEWISEDLDLVHGVPDASIVILNITRLERIKI